MYECAKLGSVNPIAFRQYIPCMESLSVYVLSVAASSPSSIIFSSFRGEAQLHVVGVWTRGRERSYVQTVVERERERGESARVCTI